MGITVNYTDAMAEVIGSQGLTAAQLSEHAVFAASAANSLRQKRGAGMTGWMQLPYTDKSALDKITSFAREVRKNFSDFVVLGIGGSALGPIAVFNALKHPWHNQLPRMVRKSPRFYVLDNVDPERVSALLDVIDPEKTMFDVVTKSGSTSETMSQYLVVMDMLKSRFGQDAAKHVVVTTSEKTGNLIKIAKEEGFPAFYVPDNVGGRFSEFSPVGLLPAAVLGIDIAKLLEGARAADASANSADYKQNPALMMALMQYLFMQKGKNIHVMMPYSSALQYVSDWYAQLWAESLGKKYATSGKVVNAGQTPVKALGVTDQHSQLQLYAEGPFDKVVTFIEVKNFRKDVTVPEGCENYPDVHFLSGHTLGELLSKELFATSYALTKAGRPNYTVSLDTIDEWHIGALLQLFMLQTAYAGEMLGVDTYNQPGVEEGKNAAYALLGRKGYENKRAELSAVQNGNYVVRF